MKCVILEYKSKNVKRDLHRTWETGFDGLLGRRFVPCHVFCGRQQFSHKSLQHAGYGRAAYAGLLSMISESCILFNENDLW